MTVQTCIILLLLLQLLLPNPIVVKAEIPAFIVFGDSTVDSGNNNFIPTIAKSDFPPYGRDFPGGRPTGRFSNGRLATDFISEFLGLGSIVPAYLDPSNNISSLASGVCFASAGTGYDTVTTDLFKVIPMKKELEYYKEYQKRLRDSIGYDKANHILREALYLTSIGTNDFILNYFLSPIRQAQFTTEEFENYFLGLATNFIRELYHLGARKFVMVSIPPIGCLPIVRTLNSLKLRDCIKEFNNVAVDVVRFTNGLLPSDFISMFLNLSSSVPAYLDPSNNISSLATAVCFASAGTGYDTVTSNLLKVIPLWQEVVHYKEYQNKLRASLGDQKTNYILGEALYFTSIGTNDFILNYFLQPLRKLQFTIDGFGNFVIGHVTKFVHELYSLGARKILMVNIPPMGCLPIARTLNNFLHRACIEDFNNVAMGVNLKLQNQVAQLNTQLPGLKLVIGDVYVTLDQLIRQPSSFGFEEASTGCCATGTIELGFLCNQLNPFTCADASKFVFWDSVHPTERTYQIIANNLTKIIQQAFT